MTRVLLVTPNFENNSLGRTYCLWQMLDHLGLNASVVGVRGRSVWGPLAGTAFAQACVLPDESTGPHEAGQMASIAERCDIVVAVKSLPSSYGVASRIARSSGLPLLLDVDDPDVEARTKWLPPSRRVASMVRDRNYWKVRALGRRARQERLTVSNPTLQAMYGGTVVPHVRPLALGGDLRRSNSVCVRFVGTVRGHKGIDLLREAVRLVASQGVRLEVTAEAPPDPRPWERWLGATTLEEGLALVRSADVIAVPSVSSGYGRAQLPVKLIDAMASGRAIVASDLPPIRWALGGTGMLVAPGRSQELADAILALGNVDMRARFGESARRRAKAMFTVEAVAPTLGRQIELALAGAPIGGDA